MLHKVVRPKHLAVMPLNLGPSPTEMRRMGHLPPPSETGRVSSREVVLSCTPCFLRGLETCRSIPAETRALSLLGSFAAVSLRPGQRHTDYPQAHQSLCMQGPEDDCRVLKCLYTALFTFDRRSYEFRRYVTAVFSYVSLIWRTKDGVTYDGGVNWGKIELQVQSLCKSKQRRYSCIVTPML